MSEDEDVILIALGSDGMAEPKEFHASMSVLTAASPHFSSMFNSSFLEATAGVVNMKIDAYVLGKLLEYMCTMKIDMVDGDAIRILPEAGYLQLDTLKDLCEKHLFPNVSVSNCLEIWQLSNAHQCPRLAKKALRIACRNVENVIGSRDFLDLDEDEVAQLFSDPRLSCSESTIWEGVSAWVRADETRRGAMSRLLSLVRLECLSSSFLLDTVGRDSLILDNDECMKMFEKAIVNLSEDRPATNRQAKFPEWTPASRLDHTCNWSRCTAVVHRGAIFCAGSGNDIVVNREGKGWKRVASPGFRYITSLCVVDDTLICIGSTDTQQSLIVEEYDDASNTWTAMEMMIVSDDDDEKPRPEKVRVMTAASADNRLFIATYHDIQVLERHSTGYKIVYFCPQPPGMGFLFCLCETNGCLVATGGAERGADDKLITGKVQRLDLASRTWEALPTMDKGRCQTALCSTDDGLVVAGGYVPGTSGSYDHAAILRDGVWETLPFLKTARANCALAYLDGVVYALGGNEAYSSIAIVETVRLDDC